MARICLTGRAGLVGVLLTVCLAGVGCHSCGVSGDCTDPQLPRELNKVTMPEYIIEAPDLLQINAVRLVPLPPYKVEPLDALAIQVKGTPMSDPISGLYPVEPDGTINLGLSYGSVSVVGKTIAEAKVAIEKHLSTVAQLREPSATVALGMSRGLQQIAGEHLVRPDGAVGLGTYGSVRVAGLSIPQAKQAIEAHLSQYLQKPEVAIEMLGFNSKVYYVILDGAGNGQQVIRLPITGNETVLDALANVYGLTAVSSKHNIWIARPAPPCAGPDQVLPVDWVGISTKGRTATNYQLLPGDRLYVQGNALVATDTFLGRVLNPIERVFGFILLGNGMVQSLRNQNGTSGGSGF
jgi:polysaccharide biosynthesis/export protein